MNDILTPEQVALRETVESELAALASEAYRLEAEADAAAKRAKELRSEYTRKHWANKALLHAWKSAAEKDAFWAQQAMLEELT